MHFFHEEALLWIMDSMVFELKRLNAGFVSAFVFSRCSLMDWSGVDYCDVFISCLDSHSDGTHSLQSIHCWDIPPNLMKKQTHPDLGWPAGEHIYRSFSYLVNCSFNALMHCWVLLSTYLRFMWLRQYLTCFTAVLIQHACGFKYEYLVGVQKTIKELFQACFRFIFASVWQYVMDAGGCLH